MESKSKTKRNEMKKNTSNCGNLIIGNSYLFYEVKSSQNY
jgi:hypothetical protein